MSWTRWVRPWLGTEKTERPTGRKARRGSKTKRQRLGLETLEDRTLFSVNVLSAANANMLSDTAAGTVAGPVSVSQNGRFVVYTDNAANLVAGQTNSPLNPIILPTGTATNVLSAENVFLYNRSTGVTTLISHAAGNTTLGADGTSENGAISADGNWIAFVSNSDNLISGLNLPSGQTQLGTDFQVYLYNVQSGVTTLVTHLAPDQGSAYDTTISAGSSGLVESSAPSNTGTNVTSVSISSDGSYLAYISTGEHLVTGQQAGTSEYLGITPANVFVYNRETDTNFLISGAAGSTTDPGNDSAFSAAIDQNGDTIAYTSYADNLVTGETDPNNTASAEQDYVAVRTGSTWATYTPALMSHDSVSVTEASTFTAQDPNDYPAPVLTPNGQFVAYLSVENNIGIEGSTGPTSVTGVKGENVYEYNTTQLTSLGNNVLVTHALNSMATASNATFDSTSAATGSAPAISTTGQYVAFTSSASNITSTAITGTITGASNTAPIVITTNTGGLTTGDQVTIKSVGGDTAANGTWTITVLSGTTFSLNGSNGTTSGTYTSGGKWTVVGYNVYLFNSQGANPANNIARVSQYSIPTTDVPSADLYPPLTPTVSGDGTYVGYVGIGSGDVPGVTSNLNGSTGLDAIVYNQTSSTYTLLSHAFGSPTTTGNGSANAPVFSDDSNDSTVLYLDAATNLIPTSINGHTGQDYRSGAASYDAMDLFAYNLHAPSYSVVAGNGDTAATPTGTNSTVTLVPTATGSAMQSQTASGQSELSPVGSTSSNGNLTVFVSTAPNLLQGETTTNSGSTENVYIYNKSTNTVLLVTHDFGSVTEEGNANSFDPVISADGSTIVLYSTATDLTNTVTPAAGTVQAWEYSFNTTSNSLSAPQLLSFSANFAGTSNGTSPSLPTNVPGSPYVNTLAYSAGSGTGGSGLGVGQDIYGLALPGVSSNGQYIVFISNAKNIGLGAAGTSISNSNVYTNVFLYDNNPADGSAFGTITLVSHSSSSTTTAAGGYASTAAISADGTTVAFTDPASNLVTGESGVSTSDELYVWSRTTNSTTGLQANIPVLASHAASSNLTAATIPNSLSGLFGYTQDSPPSLSANGTEVAYYYAGNNLVAGQTGTASYLNVFLYNTTNNTNTLVTHIAGTTTTDLETAGNNPEQQIAYESGIGQVGPFEAVGPQISADGKYIAFANNSSNLVASNTTTPWSTWNGADNVYLYDNNPSDAAYQTNTLVSNNGVAVNGALTDPDTGGGTAPSLSVTANDTKVDVAFIDYAYPATTTPPLAASTSVNVRVFQWNPQQSPPTTQPPIAGSVFDSGIDLITLSATLAPEALSADGSTLTWEGLSSNSAFGVAGKVNSNLDVFQAPNPQNGFSTSTSLTLTNSSNQTITTIQYGQTVTFTATVTVSTAFTGSLTGDTVQFFNGTTQVGTGTLTLTSTNTYTSTPFSTTTLQVGTGVTLTATFVPPTGSTVQTSSGSQTFTITPAPLSVTGITVTPKPYDGAATALLNVTTATITGTFYNGDNSTVTLVTNGATGTYSSVDVHTGIPVTATGFTLTGTDSGDYTLTQPVNLTGNITPAQVTVTGITANNKPYDGTTIATLVTTGATPHGIVGTDSGVTLVTTGAMGTFASPDANPAGTTVFISGLSLTGTTQDGTAASVDYTLVQPTTTATIGKAQVTVTGITANNKPYDGTTVATLVTSGATPHGILATDSGVTLVTGGATGTFASPDANPSGTTVLIAGLTLSGTTADGTAASADYTLVQPTTTATIGKAQVTVTGITANNKPYDGTTAATLVTSGATPHGILPTDSAVALVSSGATGTFASPDANPSGTTVFISGLALTGTTQDGTAASTDYTLVQPTTQATIGKALVTVTGITANNKPYDGTTAATLNTSGATPVGLAPTDTGVVLVSSGATGTFASPDANPTGTTVFISGVALSGTTADGTAANTDYTLVQPTTTATIGKAQVTVTGITANNKPYDGTTAATLVTSGATPHGILPTDSGVTLVNSAANGTFASPDANPAGTTVFIAGLTLTGTTADGTAASADYTLVQPTTTATIGKAQVTVTGITANNKPYDGTTAATLVTTDATPHGILPADSGVTLVSSGATGTFASPDANPAGTTVFISGLALTGTTADGTAASTDYTLLQPTTTATIGKAQVTVTGITSNNKPYDGTTAATLNTSGATPVGLAPTDTGVVLVSSGATGTFASPDANPTGTTVFILGLTLSGTTADGTAASTDYTLVQPTTTATIGKAQVTVTGITANNKPYDGTTAATLVTSGATPHGILPTDSGVTLVNSAANGTFASPDANPAGTTVFIAGLTLTGTTADGTAASADYTLVQPTTTATIGKAQVTVTGITANNKPYDGTTAATLITTDATPHGILPADSGVTLVSSGATGTFASPDANPSGTTVFIAGLTLTGTTADGTAASTDYTLVQPTTTATIGKAQVTVTGITANNKPYDGTTAATLNTSGATPVGLAPTDSGVTLVTSGATGTFASPDANSTGTTVFISGLTLSGMTGDGTTANTDCTLVQPTTQATITPYAFTYQIGSDSQTLGTPADLAHDLGTTILTGVNGENLAITYGSPGDTASAPVGQYPITGTPANGTGRLSNYTVSLRPGTLTVASLPSTSTQLTLTNSGNQTITTTQYGLSVNLTALVTVNSTFTGSLSGDAVQFVNGATSLGSGTLVSIGNNRYQTTVTTSDLPVGSDNLTATFLPGSSQVQGSFGTQTLLVTPALLTVTDVTVSPKTYNGNTNASLNLTNATLTGTIYNGDIVSLNTAGAGGAFTSPDVNNNIVVNTTGFTLTGPGAGNYTLTQPSLTGNITPAQVTVTGITANNKPYDGTTVATLVTSGANPHGIVDSGVTLVTTGATGTFASPDANPAGTTVLISGLALTGTTADGTAANADYTLVQPTTTATIGKAQVTVTGITADNKPYDGTTSATLSTSGAAPVGLAPTDSGVTLLITGATGTFASPDANPAGTTVSISGLSLSGTTADGTAANTDYTLVQPTTTATIGKAQVTVTGITANNKPYDGTTAAILVTSEAAPHGIVDLGVTLVTSGATGTFASPDANPAGTTVFISGLTLTGTTADGTAANTDYTLVQPTTTATIGKAQVTVTGITANNKPYDGTSSARLVTSGANPHGIVDSGVTLVITGATGTFASPDANPAGTTVFISGLALTGTTQDGTAANSDYMLVQPTTMATIGKAQATVTGITAANKPYDGTTAATLNTSGAAPVGLAPTDSGVTLETTGAAGTFASPDANPAGTAVSISGLSLSGTTADGTAANTDYTLVQPTTTATIGKAQVTVTGITAANKPYDGTTAAQISTTGATPHGIVPTDSPTVTFVSGGATGTFASPDADPAGTTVFISGLTLTGTTADGTAASVDYTLVQPTTQATIGKAQVTVTGITADNKPYDGTTAATLLTSGAAPHGIVDSGVSLVVTGAAGTFASPDANPAGTTVFISGLTLTGTTQDGTAANTDYTLVQPTTQATMGQAQVTVTGITANNKPYDGTTAATLNTSGATPVGLAPTDTGVVLVSSGATGTFASPDANPTGTTVFISGLTLSGTTADGTAASTDYTLVQPTTAATITPAQVTVTGITANNKPYDGTAAATLVTTWATPHGIVDSGVTLVVAGATGTFASPDANPAGTTAFIAGLTLSGTTADGTAASVDYTLTQPTTTATIGKAQVTVTGITAINKAYDGTTAATLVGASGATPHGILPSDSGVTLATSGATGTFASPDSNPLGTTVFISALALSGTTADGTAASVDYTLTQPTTMATIGQALVTGTGITASNKSYDGTTAATLQTGGATPHGIVATDSGVKLVTSGATGTFASPGVNTGITVQVSGLTLSGTTADGTAASVDYTLTQPTTQANITPATLTVTTASNLSRPFGQANPNFTPLFSPFVNGEGTSVLSGSPSITTQANLSSTPGTYQIVVSQGTLSAANYTFNFVNQILTVTNPAGKPPVFTSAKSVNFLANVTNTYQTTVSGTWPITFTLASTPIVPGFTSASINSSTGVITGVPTTSGTFTFSVTAKNAVGSATLPVTVNVGTAPVFTGPTTVNYVLNVARTYLPAATGSAPITFALVPGSDNIPGMPASGFNTATGALTGTPNTAGSYSFSETATNNFGSTQLNVTVNVGTLPAFTSLTTVNYVANTANTYLPTWTGSTPVIFALVNHLVPGMAAFSTSTGAFSGTPTASGTFTEKLTNMFGSAQITVTVNVGTAPAFTNAATVTLTGGVAASFTPAVTGTEPIAFTLSNDTVPGVTTFDTTTGKLSGTPTTAGTFTFTETATNNYGTAQQTVAVTVNGAAPPVITSTTATFLPNEGNAFQLLATSAGTTTFALAPGSSLPSWLTLSPGGLLSSSHAPTDPPANSPSPITFFVIGTNSFGASSRPTLFTLHIGTTPAFTNTSPPAFVIGRSNTFTFTTSGDPQPAITETSALPAGLSFVDNGDGTATLSGTPAAGTANGYVLHLKAKNLYGTATAAFGLTVEQAQAPVITAGTYTFVAGVSNTVQVATGFPLNFTVSGGTLPAWLSLSPFGTMSGTAPASTAGHSFPFTLTATNTAGHTSGAITVQVVSTPVITSAASATFVVGVTGHTFQMTASSLLTPTFSLAPNSVPLPAGLTLSPAGLLSGTAAPGTGGIYTLTVQATNIAGASPPQTFVLTVDEAPSFTNTSSLSLVAGENLTPSFIVATTGFSAAPTTITATGLPSGLSLTDNGNGSATIQGVPTTAGTKQVTLTVSNGIGTNGTETLTVSVKPSITFSDGTQAANVFEYRPTGTVVGTLVSTDPNVPVSGLSITGGNTNNAFALSGDELVTNAVLTSTATYNITITGTNSEGNVTSTPFTITVEPTTQTGTVALSNTTVDAGLAVGALVGNLSVVNDPNVNQTYSFTFDSSTPAASLADFQIVGNRLQTKVVFSVSTRTTFNLTVDAASSPDGLTAKQTFTITVFPQPILTLSPTTVKAAQPIGTLVGTVGVLDPDPGDSYTFALQTPNSNFTLSGTSLDTAQVFAVGAPTNLPATLEVTDNTTGQTATETFTITVMPAPPTAILISNSTVSGAVKGTAIGTLSTVDPNANQTFTYSIISQADPSTGQSTSQLFTITQGVLRTNTVINVRGTTQIPVMIQTTDSLGLTYDQIIVITVTADTRDFSGGFETPDRLDVPETPLDEAPSDTKGALLETPGPDLGTPDLVAATSEEPNLPAFNPEIYTVSVTAFVDDPSFHTSTIGSLTFPGPSRPVGVPADQVFSNLLPQQQPTGTDEVELALWVVEPPQDQAAQVRAAVDQAVFASSDGPGTAAWGLAAFGGFAALRGKTEERDEEENHRSQPPAE